jgi:hypothetical protein
MEDTAYFNMPTHIMGGKKFDHWDLPGLKEINYTTDKNGTLKIIFDCDNYFYNNNISDGQITITAIYK